MTVSLEDGLDEAKRQRFQELVDRNWGVLYLEGRCIQEAPIQMARIENGTVITAKPDVPKH